MGSTSFFGGDGCAEPGIAAADYNHVVYLLWHFWIGVLMLRFLMPPQVTRKGSG